MQRKRSVSSGKGQKVSKTAHSKHQQRTRTCVFVEVLQELFEAHERGGGRGRSTGTLSYLLDLLADHNGVVSTDLLRAHLSVVEGTVVLVTVSVYGTVEAPAAALEAS